MVCKLGGLGKTLAGPLPSLPDAGCLRTGQRVCGSQRPPGDVAAGLETALGELTSYSKGRRDRLVLTVPTPAPSLSPRSVFTFLPFPLGPVPSASPTTSLPSFPSTCLTPNCYFSFCSSPSLCVPPPLPFTLSSLLHLYPEIFTPSKN